MLSIKVFLLNHSLEGLGLEIFLVITFLALGCVLVVAVRLVVLTMVVIKIILVDWWCVNNNVLGTRKTSENEIFMQTALIFRVNRYAIFQLTIMFFWLINICSLVCVLGTHNNYSNV